MQLSPKEIRQEILQMAYRGKTVHIPSAFSIVEIVAALYGKVLQTNDHFVLSKGHGTMAVYVALEAKGVLERSDLENYFQNKSRLHGLPEVHTPGIEVSGGSLGHGLSIAVGMAFGLKRQKSSSQKVYCLIGDGELNEGPNWEAMLFAAHHKLDNLIVILDFNKYQAMGKVEDVLGLEPLDQKFMGFGFDYQRCDGHALKAVVQSLETLRDSSHKGPRALVADTVKGKGVSFMEDNNTWHYTVLDEENFVKAMEEVRHHA